MMRRRITAATTVTLRPIASVQQTDGPLFAVNWFNTRWAWLYTLYNLLAAGSLSKVGGRAVLKARRLKTLYGPLSAGRELLLVVRYPSGERFLDLLHDRVFQIISVLRLLAVKDLSFVFHHRRDNRDAFEAAGQEYDGGKAYAVHHFRSPGSLDTELARIETLLAAPDISLFFASEKAATVVIENARGKRRTMPYGTHKLVIFEADRLAVLEDALTGPAYRGFLAELEASYIGTFERVI